MSSPCEIKGIAPRTAESEVTLTEESDVAQPAEIQEDWRLDETEIQKTPTKKSILREAGSVTPQSERKRVRFTQPRKSLSFNLTPACSPAYHDRKSIAREDMADFTFLLEKSSESSRNASPVASSSRSSCLPKTLGRVNSPKPSGSQGGVNSPKPSGSQGGVNSPKPSGSQGGKEDDSFEISRCISMVIISSPLRKSWSTTELNRLGLQSTPIRIGSPGLERFKRRTQTNFFGTPQAQRGN